MTTLRPGATNVLRYLVLQRGLHNPAPTPDLAQAVPLSPTDLNDAVEELKRQRLVTTQGQNAPYQFSQVEPTVSAWLEMTVSDLGYDVRNDAVTVARCVEQHGTVDTQTLETETTLPQQRINIAALILEAQHRLKLHKAAGTYPYDFYDAEATYDTRQWLQSLNP